MIAWFNGTYISLGFDALSIFECYCRVFRNQESFCVWLSQWQTTLQYYGIPHWLGLHIGRHATRSTRLHCVVLLRKRFILAYLWYLWSRYSTLKCKACIICFGSSLCCQIHTTHFCNCILHCRRIWIGVYWQHNYYSYSIVLLKYHYIIHLKFGNNSYHVSLYFFQRIQEYIPMGPTWGTPGSCRPQMGPMFAP